MYCCHTMEETFFCSEIRTNKWVLQHNNWTRCYILFNFFFVLLHIIHLPICCDVSVAFYSKYEEKRECSKIVFGRYLSGKKIKYIIQVIIEHLNHVTWKWVISWFPLSRNLYIHFWYHSCFKKGMFLEN